MIEFSPQLLISFEDVPEYFLSCSLKVLFVFPRKPLFLNFDLLQMCTFYMSLLFID